LTNGTPKSFTLRVLAVLLLTMPTIAQTKKLKKLKKANHKTLTTDQDVVDSGEEFNPDLGEYR